MTGSRASGQEALPGFALPRSRPGRNERRVTRACQLRRRSGALSAEDDALIVLAVTVARQLDRCEATEQPYAVAQLAGRMVEIEAALRERSGGAGSDFERFLSSLSTPGAHGT